MSKDDSGGLMSSAGLVRYFESEDRNAIHIDPKTLVAWGVVFGVVIQMLNAIDLGGSGFGSSALLIVLFAFVGLTAGMIARAATQGEV